MSILFVVRVNAKEKGHIEGECSKKIHFKNVMEITNMSLRQMLSYQMKPNMVP